MSEPDLVETKEKAPVMQARGKARREKLVSAAAELLDEQGFEEVSLADIAKRAQIPTASAYHFYPNANAVFAAVAQQFGESLEEALSAPYSGPSTDSWQAILREAIDRAVKIYRDKPAYRQLIISGKAPAEIKLSDRSHDEQVGQILIDAVSQHFVVPEFPRMQEIFFYATEIADLMFTLSMIKHDNITDEMVEEAKRSIVSYLRTYLPEVLSPRVKF